MMLSVEISNALPKLDLSFKSTSGRLAIFGPSGAGKTTALKIIAGLLRPDAATVKLDDTIWQSDNASLPPHLRRAAFVFQDDRLFPHMSVAANLAYGGSEDRSIDMDRLTEMTGIQTLMDRSVHTLSGGERKRVAIARALAASPSLLLLDEPYAGLDRRTADHLRSELASLLAELEVPHILVSHHLDDVLAHAREVLLLEDGVATGFGAPEEVFATDAGQRLIGLSDELLTAGPTTVLTVVRSADQSAEGLTRWELSNGKALMLAGREEAAQTAYVRIRGSDISLSTSRPGTTSVLNVFEATVVSLNQAGDFVDVNLDLGESAEEQSGLGLSARITSYSATHLALAPGQQIFAMIKSAAITR